MSSTLNFDDLKDEPILYYENALSYVFSSSGEDNKKDIPTCVIHPNKNIKIGFPLHSINNINKKEQVPNENDVQNNRFNEEPLIAYASESKTIYPRRVKIYYIILYILVCWEILLILSFREHINFVTTGDINLLQKSIFSSLTVSHILLPLSRIPSLKGYIFDVYTSISVLFFILSLLTINSFSSAFISLIQFFIFYVHSKINFYVNSQACVIPP